MTVSNNLDTPGLEDYAFRVRGELGAEWSEWFDGLEVCVGDGETVLWGPIRDQAALYGMIAKFRNMGLELISVCQR